MAGKSINYYGYDKESYDECIDMIHSSNRNHIMVMNLWFLAVVLIYFLLSVFNLFNLSRDNALIYFFYVLGSLIYGLVIGLCPKFSEKHCYAFLLINIVFMYSYGILVSVFRPFLPSNFYLILLTLTALSYTDTMFSMLITTVLLSTVYLWTSYRFKTFSIAYIDTFNLLVVQILVTGMHFLYQRMRIQQYLLYLRNIQIQRELEVKSSFDTLTGLLNRGIFFSIAEEILNLNDGSKIAIALLDLDGFKEINDTVGHQMGDKVIQITGRTIIDVLEIGAHYKKAVSEWNLNNVKGLAGRLGGDEFIVLYRAKDENVDLHKIFAEILRRLNKVSIDGFGSGIRGSIGYTELDDNNRDLDVAYKCADDALYMAKKGGKNQVKKG